MCVVFWNKVELSAVIEALAEEKSMKIILSLFMMSIFGFLPSAHSSAVGDVLVNSARITSENRFCFNAFTGWGNFEACSAEISSEKDRQEFVLYVQMIQRRAEMKKRLLLRKGALVNHEFKLEFIRFLILNSDSGCVESQSDIVQCE